MFLCYFSVYNGVFYADLTTYWSVAKMNILAQYLTELNFRLSSFRIRGYSKLVKVDACFSSNSQVGILNNTSGIISTML
jgi:hypothetical protein